MSLSKETLQSERPLLHRIASVQRLTGLGRTSIYKLIGEDKLPVVKVGRATLIRDDDLHAWLNSLSSNDGHAS